MTYKIDKVTYIVAVFFIVSILDFSFNFLGMNVRVIFYCGFALIIFRDVLKANIEWLIAKSKFSTIKIVSYLYFLCHPILISVFGFFGFWGLSATISPSSIILSGANMTLQVLIGIFFLIRINTKNFAEINKFICFIAWFFLVEFFISIFFSVGKAFGTSNEFVSFVNSEWMISLFALLAFHCSAANFSISRNRKYLVYAVCFLFLGYVAQLRIFQLGAAIYVFLTLAMFLKVSMTKLVAVVFSALIAFVGYSLSSLNNLDSASLYDRFYLFAKQIDLISNNFIFGVGGNVSEKYYLTTSPHLLTIAAEAIGLTKLESFNHVISVNEHLDHIGYYVKRSSHSTQLDLIGDYGILGIVMVSVWIIWPLKILNSIGKIQKRSVLDLQAQHAAIAVLSLLGFNSLESGGQYLWIVFLGFSYMLYLDRCRIQSVFQRN